MHSNFGSRNDAAPHHGRSCRLPLRNRVCRLDFSVTAIFLIFLLSVAVLTSTVSQVLVSQTLQQQWELVHQVRVTTATKRIGSDSNRVRNIAIAFLAIHARSNLSTNSARTIRYLCASLDRYDQAFAYRALTYLSLDNAEGAGCAHGMEQMPTLRTMVGWIFVDHIADGTYLVEERTYQYSDPPVKTSEFSPENRNASKTMPINYNTQKLFPLAKAFHNGSITTMDPRYNWMYPARMPHLILYNLPIGEVLPGAPLQPGQSASDFVQVRLDGSAFLISTGALASGDFAAAAFIRQSLNTTSPLIFSNNWGQQSVSNNSIYSPSVYFNVTYLNATDVTSPLMRAALRYVDYESLQGNAHRHRKQFTYRGAAAIVTSRLVTTSSGLTVPFVFASQQRYVTSPYVYYRIFFDCITALAVVLFTALMWWFVHTEYSQPLDAMTKLLLESLETGKRTTMRAARGAFIQSTETAELIQTFNAFVRRLRQIETFVPRDVRLRFLQQQQQQQQQQPANFRCRDNSPDKEGYSTQHHDTNALQQYHVTMVHVLVRSTTVSLGAVNTFPIDPLPFDNGVRPRRGQRLAAAVECAAHAGGVANSGTFPSAAALSAFTTAVHDVAAQYGGVVRNLTPDGCAVHFAAAVCANMPFGRTSAAVTSSDDGGGGWRDGQPESGRPYDEAAMRSHIEADARSGIAFALALQRRVDAAWLRYSRCCTEGFECMVHGDYAGALRAYKGVADIRDLEPGLLPRCLSREAAASAVTGGAVSVQVQRLIKECEKRVAQNVTTGYCKNLPSPCGIDRVLLGMPVEQRVNLGSRSVTQLKVWSNCSGSTLHDGHCLRLTRVIQQPHYQRAVVVVPTIQGDVRCVVGGKPEMLLDNNGMKWWISKRSVEGTVRDPWKTEFVALGAAGSICLASFLPFREMHPLVTKAATQAPCGPMSDALRSAVPVHDATPKQLRAIEELVHGWRRLDHPNLASLDAYSLSVEGGVVMLKSFAPGGKLSEVMRRFPTMTPMATARFAFSMLSALAYLHAKGCVHGAVSLDNVVVCGDGQCRLRGFFENYGLADATFLLPTTYWISPAMAAGHPPTPACDVFCYGLLWLEGLSGKKPWCWAPDAAGEPHGTDQELEDLMAQGGQSFCAAVVEGRVVVALHLFELDVVKSHLPPIAWEAIRRCVSFAVSERPTSLWLFYGVRGLVGDYGAEVED